VYDCRDWRLGVACMVGRTWKVHFRSSFKTFRVPITTSTAWVFRPVFERGSVLIRRLGVCRQTCFFHEIVRTSHFMSVAFNRGKFQPVSRVDTSKLSCIAIPISIPFFSTLSEQPPRLLSPLPRAQVLTSLPLHRIR